MKYSFIIPTYNVEKYINQAIDSILVQEYENYEILVVDDGSTDGTINNCKKYKDDRIKIINIKHCGVSAARNEGISNATGDYIIFLDGDDYLESFMLKELNNIINYKNPDCVIGMFNVVREDGVNHYIYSENVLKKNIVGKSQEEVLHYIYRLRLIFTVWRFVVKTDIVKNQIFFREGIIHEDEEWVPQMLLKCKKFCVMEKPYYNYRLRSNSIMNSDNKAFRAECLLGVSQRLLALSKNCEYEYQKLFLQRCSYKNIFQAYIMLRKCSKPQKPIKTRKYKHV